MSRKSSSKSSVITPVSPAGEPWGLRVLQVAARWAVPLTLLLVLLGTARIVTTYSSFNHTIDEPAHIACGMEWLAKGVYRIETQHPPLARVMTALGPWLAGGHPWGRPSMYSEGAAILYGNDGSLYARNLLLARLGILPFFWLACGVVFAAAARLGGRPAAVFAVGLFTFLPAILAHAGLATTDMALTATLGAALLVAVLWCQSPTAARAILLGLFTALTILSKFSSLAYLPAALLAMAAAAHLSGVTLRALWTRRHAATIVLSAAVAVLVIWAGYRFSFGGNSLFGSGAPAPELFDGIQSVRAHNAIGHPAYLLGARSQFGWWYYYLVALAVKTPIAFLGLLVWGIVLAWRRRQTLWLLPLAGSVGIVLFTFFTSINIGVRHVLPVYLGFAIVAALAMADLLDRSASAKWAARTLACLLGWFALTGAASHPDYLAYFNFIASPEPERILVDSDLDWGQDMNRLSRRLQELGASSVTFDPFISAHLERYHGFPPIQASDPFQPSEGWNAVSLTVLRTARLGLYDENPGQALWPDRFKPVERVGAGILLYYFPPARPQAR